MPRLLQQHFGRLKTYSPLSLVLYTDVFESVFRLCNNSLTKQSFDVKMSGSTVVLVLFDGTRLICANAGDSRAIKTAVFKHENKMVCTALNVDHKPDLAQEA